MKSLKESVSWRLVLWAVVFCSSLHRSTKVCWDGFVFEFDS